MGTLRKAISALTSECREASSGKQAFDDVELGCLLGQGSYGKVFRGVWGGKEIAVKVITSDDFLRRVELGASND